MGFGSQSVKTHLPSRCDRYCMSFSVTILVPYPIPVAELFIETDLPCDTRRVDMIQ